MKTTLQILFSFLLGVVASAQAVNQAHLRGTTNVVQTQLNAKLPLTGGTVSGSVVVTNASTFNASSTNLTLEARGSFKLYTPGIATGSVESGYVLRLNDDANGQAEYVPLQVSTVAALKALPVGSVPDGWMVQTTGYYTDSDQGQATYVYRASSTATADNGSVIDPTFLPGRFILQADGEVNVRQFGAVGYQTAYAPYVARTNTVTLPGTGNFTLWVDFQVPTYTTDASSLFRLSAESGLANSFEGFAASTYFAIIVRTTGGSSSTGAGAGQLISATNVFSAQQGTRIQASFVRTNGIVRVYRGTNDITAAFTVTNSGQVAASIGNGVTAGVLSTSQQSANFPQAPVFTIKQFNSAFTLAQLEGASTNTSFIATVASPNKATSLVDSGPAIQAAINYAQSSGLRNVKLPGGYYLTGQQINVLAGVSISGDGNTQWSTAQTFTSSQTKVGLTVGSTATNVFRIDDSMSDKASVNLQTTFTDGSYATNYFHGGSISRMWIDASASKYAIPFEVSKVTGVNIDKITLQQNRGATFRIFGANNVNVRQANTVPSIGALMGGLYILTSDSHIEDLDYGGGDGVGLLFFNANKNKISDSFVWNQTASTGQLTSPTVDTGADTFAATGHNYFTGMPVRFVANGGTLPSPLAEGAMYFAIRVGADTIAVNSQYDQGAAGGALQGVKLNLTTGGSGSWLMRPYTRNDANIVMSDSSVNILNGGRYDQAYDSAMVLDNCYGVTASALFTEAGWNGSATSPGVIITGGQSNIITGSVLGKVRSSSQSDIGVLLTNTVGNVVRNNIYYGLTTRVSGSSSLLSLARPDVLTTPGDFLISAGTALATTSTNGFLNIPAMLGPPTGTPTDYGDTAPLVADFTNRRIYYNDNGTWRHSPYWTGTTGASVSTANTLTLTPNGNASALITSSSIAGNTWELYNANATPAVRISTYAANGTTASPTQITAFQTIFDLQPGARTDAGGYNNGYARLRAIVSENQTASAAGAYWVFGASASGTAITNVLTVAGTGTDVIGRVTATQGATLGSNGRAMRILDYGNAQLGAGGTVTVAETDVTNSGRIILTSNFDGGTPGWLRVSARVVNTSFTITSSSATDTSTVSWILIEP